MVVAWLRTPEGAVCAAVGAGIVAMIAGGAPPSYPAINMAALIVAMATAHFGPRALGVRTANWLGPVAVALLWVPIVAGPDIDGARRWLSLGPVTLHAAMLVLPMLMLRVAASGQRTGTVLLVLAASAITLQPDRASALALLSGTLALALQRRSSVAAVWCAIAAAGLAITVIRADRLQPVRFVESVLADTWSLHAILAIALIAGLFNLVTIGIVTDRSMRIVSACLAGYCVAAALAPYPWPFIGYGAAAILGYGLAIATSRIAERPE